MRSIAQDGERGSESLATRAALGRWLGSTFGVDATDSLLSLAPILLCLVFANENSTVYKNINGKNRKVTVRYNPNVLTGLLEHC